MKDLQKSKVYRWEEKLFLKYGLTKSMPLEKSMSYSDCEKFATKVWNKYKNKFFKVLPHNIKCSQVKIFPRQGRKATFHHGLFFNGVKAKKRGYRTYYKKIVLPDWARSKHIVIHEVCHALTERLDGGHGKYYVGTYMLLLNKYLGFEISKMCDLAYKMKIDWTFDGSRTMQKAKEKAIKPEIEKERKKLTGGKINE